MKREGIGYRKVHVPSYALRLKSCPPPPIAKSWIRPCVDSRVLGEGGEGGKHGVEVGRGGREKRAGGGSG